MLTFKRTNSHFKPFGYAIRNISQTIYQSKFRTNNTRQINCVTVQLILGNDRVHNVIEHVLYQGKDHLYQSK